MATWHLAKKYPRLSGALRVASFFGALQLALTLALLPTARAKGEQAVKHAGLSLLRQLGPEVLGEPDVARINGQRMLVASKLTPLGIPDALARFEGHCREQSGTGGFGAALGKLPEAELGPAMSRRLLDPASWLTAREMNDDGKSGQLVCMARPNAAGGIQGLMNDIGTFFETGDLASLGHARYVVARRDEASNKTFLVAMWTEGSFSIVDMFPEAGDAPGSDSSVAPRPPGGKRVFTGELEGKPYAIRMYDTQRTPEEMRAFYQQEMPKRGWSLQPLPVANPEMDMNEFVSAFAKDSSAVMVVTHDTPAGLTGVTLVEMGSRGFVQARAH